MDEFRLEQLGLDGYYLLLLRGKFFAFMGQNSKQFFEGSNSGSS